MTRTSWEPLPHSYIELAPAPAPTPSQKSSRDGSVHSDTTRLDLDWGGPDDPENPKNWSVGKKVLHTAIPAYNIFALQVTAAISTLVPAIPAIMIQFDKTRTIAILLRLRSLYRRPISEIHSRQIIYQTNFVMLVVVNAIAAASDNFVLLVVFRFLAGFGGSGAMSVGAGTLADLFEQRQVGRVGVTYLLAPFVGQAIGPLIGAYSIEQYDDWKWAIWVILYISAPLGVRFLFMSETSKEKILSRRANKRGSQSAEDLAVKLKRAGKAMLRPWHMCVIEPVSLILGLYTGYTFAMLFSFLGSYIYVYSAVAVLYIPVIIGILLGLVTFVVSDVTKYQKEVVRTGDKVAPEHRLYAAMLGSLLTPISLFWYAFTPRESIHWIVPVLAGIPFGWGLIASFLAILAYLAATYSPADLATAVAANGIMRFTLGAVFPLFIIPVYQSIGIQKAGSVFACISVVFIPVPWLFFWKGRELRKRSHYETSPY